MGETAAKIADIVDRWHVLDDEAWQRAGADLYLRLLRTVPDPGPVLTRAIDWLAGVSPDEDVDALMGEARGIANAEFSIHPFGDGNLRASLACSIVRPPNASSDAGRFQALMRDLTDDSGYRKAVVQPSEVVAAVVETLDQWISTAEGAP